MAIPLPNLPSHLPIPLKNHSKPTPKPPPRVKIPPLDDPTPQILRLCDLGDLNHALETLSHLDSDRKRVIDSSTYSSIFDLCSASNALPEGRRLHSLVSSLGLDLGPELGEKIVFFYFKCGDLDEGRRVLDVFGDRMSPFLWSFVLNEYAKIGEFEESLVLFRKMRLFGVGANSYSCSCVLKCVGLLGTGGVEGIHAHVLKSGFGGNVVVGNALFACYFRCGLVEEALRVFDGMPERDVVSWNSVISGCVSSGFGYDGIGFFLEMLGSGVDADLATFVSVFPAFAELGVLLHAKTLHGRAVKAGFGGVIVIDNVLVDIYSKCGDLESAAQVFERMSGRTVVSWTSMVTGYARSAKVEEAIKLFMRMEVEGVTPDLFVITSVLHACACCGSLDKGKYVHNYITREGLEVNVFVANALMDMYAKCKSLEDARAVFDHMIDRDVVSWNTMIGGYSKNRFHDEALELFRTMQNHVKPNSTTMSCILSAIAGRSSLKAGKEVHAYVLKHSNSLNGHIANALVDMYAKCGVVSLARRIFDGITTKDIVLWTVMIAGYCMNGNGKEAILVFKSMRRFKVEPSKVFFIAVLNACGYAGLVDEGWLFFNTMRIDCKMDPDLDHYICMVEMLCRAERLSRAYKFVQSIPSEIDSRVWRVLLHGCRIHGNVELAEKVAEHIFRLEPENTEYYMLLSNIYAEAEKYEMVNKLRERKSINGLRKKQKC